MDPLTDMLSLLRPRSLLWKELETTGDWAIAFPGHRGTVFFLVEQGGCAFVGDGYPPRLLRAGDFVLLHAPAPWRLGSVPEIATVPVEQFRRSRSQAATEGGDKDLSTRILGGGFDFAAPNAAMAAELLPPLIEITSDRPGAARLRAVLEGLADETATARPGGRLVIDRLLDILLVEVIRLANTSPVPTRPGLRTALADPRLALALEAMHAQPAQGWTVAELANVAGMSRSVFAERFVRLVGVPPFDYLLRWRMARAKDAIRFERLPMVRIAEQAGYQSLSAFSAAFRRTVGCSPRAYRAREEMYGVA